MEDTIVDAVHKIANYLYERRGYHITIRKSDVATVLEAAELMNNKIEEDYNGKRTERKSGI